MLVPRVIPYTIDYNPLEQPPSAYLYQNQNTEKHQKYVESTHQLDWDKAYPSSLKSKQKHKTLLQNWWLEKPSFARSVAKPLLALDNGFFLWSELLAYHSLYPWIGSYAYIKNQWINTHTIFPWQKYFKQYLSISLCQLVYTSATTNHANDMQNVSFVYMPHGLVVQYWNIQASNESHTTISYFIEDNPPHDIIEKKLHTMIQLGDKFALGKNYTVIYLPNLYSIPYKYSDWQTPLPSLL
jgi:hypothetical protein